MTSTDKALSIKAWIIKQVLANPKKSVVLPLLVTLFVGMGINHIVIDDDMMAMLPESLESKISWDAVQDEFGSTEVIFIAFGNKNKTIYRQETFSILRELTEALENLDQVEKVSSIATLSRMDSQNGFMEISDLQPGQELTPIQINQI